MSELLPERYAVDLRECEAAASSMLACLRAAKEAVAGDHQDLLLCLFRCHALEEFSGPCTVAAERKALNPTLLASTLGMVSAAERDLVSARDQGLGRATVPTGGGGRTAAAAVNLLWAAWNRLLRASGRCRVHFAHSLALVAMWDGEKAVRSLSAWSGACPWRYATLVSLVLSYDGLAIAGLPDAERARCERLQRSQKFWEAVGRLDRIQPAALSAAVAEALDFDLDALTAELQLEFSAASRAHPDQVNSEVDKESLALSWLVRGETNLSRIAKKIGVPRTNLYGWPRFQKYYRQMKAQQEQAKRSRRRGRRAGDRDFEVDEG
jgi:hypothetical protein